MKRLWILCVVCMLIANFAFAETHIDPVGDRGIIPQAAEAHVSEAGISPTTGLTLSEINIPEGATGLAATGRYMPMMVQISNPVSPKTKAAGTSNRAPWGVQYADLIYELPLHKNGETRLSAIFSDVIPTEAGPIRSARMGHVWLREEWDCGFMYYGQSTYKEGNVPAAFASLGTEGKGVLFSGIVSSIHPWKQYYSRGYKRKAEPEDVNGNVAEISKLIPETHIATNHTFLFTDEIYSGGDEANVIMVDWHRPSYNSMFEFDAETGAYKRSVADDKRNNTKYYPWIEFNTQEPLLLSNVIVQWTPTEFIRVDIPVTCNVEAMGHPGEGNADIFMCGRHISGYWKREGMNTRTVFYDENGQEISLQRGKTMIIQLPLDRECYYE